MIFTDSTFKFFSLLQSNIRASIVKSPLHISYRYEGEDFFNAYEAIELMWKKRMSQRNVARKFEVSRSCLNEWEQSFAKYGTYGLLSRLSFVDADPRLERLVLLVKSAYVHAKSSAILTLSQALNIPGANIELICRIQRSYGYGQRQDEQDVSFYHELQKILSSVQYYKESMKEPIHDIKKRAETFLNYDKDILQHNIELFKALNFCDKKKQIRTILKQFGVHSSIFYEQKRRYLIYGIWSLVDLIHTSRRVSEKICPELELQIIEDRLMDPSLSTGMIIKELKLQCSKSNVKKIYSRWGLSVIKEAVPIRGVLSSSVSLTHKKKSSTQLSTRLLFPDLIKEANLKVNRVFSEFLKTLSFRKVPVSNPGAIIMAPFLEQLGIVESIYTYGPETLRTTEITNDIIVNVLRIIAGFPTINRYMLNSDRSVAIGAGILNKPCKSAFYRDLDEFRFHHLQKLRNDLAIRAKELNIIQGQKIAIDYHCDQSDSRYPHDVRQSKAPDKNGDLVYAHRPQLLWDSLTNSIINIAYCEGRSRAPSALYHFLEENLFKIIEPDAIDEIFADSEYTGEKQLVYLHIRSKAHITMCLKQNKKIKKWKEETIKSAHWQPYEKNYRITSLDYILPETRKNFRFVVKQNIETNEIRCFGSTNTHLSAKEILDYYHIRWPVETGIRDLIENYFLNHPIGNSPEKVELHYYCVMIARLVVDYFKSVFQEPKWQSPEGWKSVLSTIRTSIFSNQNCELSLDKSGDLLLTYLDGDPTGLKTKLKELLNSRKVSGLNKVSWWNNRSISVEIEDRYDWTTGS
jgi:transposase